MITREAGVHVFPRGVSCSLYMHRFADWTMFHAAGRGQCELPLLPARGAEAMRVATFVRCHSWLVICSFQKCVNAFVPIVHQNTPSNRGGGAVCLPQAPRRNSEVLFVGIPCTPSVAGVLDRIALSWSFPDICILFNRYQACELPLLSLFERDL